MVDFNQQVEAALDEARRNVEESLRKKPGSKIVPGEPLPVSSRQRIYKTVMEILFSGKVREFDAANTMAQQIVEAAGVDELGLAPDANYSPRDSSLYPPR